eukprot:TRINITY_DN2551_c0_g1_i1.p2 TRINITY_DN2551_c0_g1~~TRINITY_DN2551_c0_g1_i1.p2  ORF type:complete len:194 (+),score=93.95 TRINITY_DN2551_c0_g1_i1:459-1040(+)
MMSTSAAVLCAVVLVMLPTAEAASAKKLYSWGEVLSRCGSDARDDHPAEGAVCMTHFNNATKDFSPCEEGYCTCTGSVWNATSRTCDTSTSTCGVSCKCMEKCYANFMSCTFGEIYRHFDTAECIKSEIKECVKDSEEQFVDECKRGVKDGRISWMESPLSSTDCDEELVCAGGAFSPMFLTTAVLALLAVLC